MIPGAAFLPFAGRARGPRRPWAVVFTAALSLVCLATEPASAQGTASAPPVQAPRFNLPDPPAAPAPGARTGAASKSQGSRTRVKTPGTPGTAAQGGEAAVSGVPGEVSVSPQRVRIGDRIRLTASYPAAGAWAAAPGEDLKPGEKLGPFRILSSDVSVPGALTLELGPDEAGALTVPAFSLIFRDAGGVSVTVAVPSARVTVGSVLAEGDSTSISDLKPPAELAVPWPWATLAMLGAAVLLAAGATWWLARYLRRARAPRPQPEIALPPGVTAEEWAREELGKILAAGLLEPGRHREAHIAIADLVRRYLELRFRVPAMERTTGEIGDEMPRALIDGTIVRLTIAALERCDRVKFAKHVPSREEVDETLAQVREILDRGAPPVPEPAAGGPTAESPPAAIDAAGTAA